MEAADGVVTAQVTTAAPVLRRGLVRAATTAGFTLVPADAAAQVSLRADDGGRDIAGSVDVDVVVQSDSVVVTVWKAPDLATVVRLQGLLALLLNRRALPEP